MKRIVLSFLWHLHQPQYRLRDEKSCMMPWVRLHGIRAYYDMVRVLEEFPEIRLTLNLVPCLLDQIRAYERGATDAFLEAGAVPAEELDEAQRAFLIERFFSAGEARMIGSLPAYAEMSRRRHQARRVRGREEAWKEFSAADFRDLQALFDLSWFGFKAQEDFPEIRALRGQGRGFVDADIRHIHAIEREILARLIPLYRRAAASGQAEISSSPYAHPILPLLCDTHSAREALPDLMLPGRLRAPEDAEKQIAQALDLMEREIGVRPKGMWPSEGSVSQETALLLARCGVRWAASDEMVLAASEREDEADPSMPWRLAEAPDLDLVFRNHELSDRVGFTYSGKSAAEAAGNFVAFVGQRAEERAEDPGLLLVALDGENPWENYPAAGADFLRGLYGALLGNRRIQCLPVGEAIEAVSRRGLLGRLRAGSWIGANFGIWIGGEEKNRAWERIQDARRELAPLLSDPSIPAAAREQAWGSLRAAEGSDWFWWLDGQFSSNYRAEFDRIFRAHLKQAYEALGRTPPEILEEAIPAAASLMEEAPPPQPAIQLSPRIDGFESDFFEWEGAIRLAGRALERRGTMERAQRSVEALEFGFAHAGEFVLRLDPAPGKAASLFGAAGVQVTFRTGPESRHLTLALDEAGNLKSAKRWSGAPEADKSIAAFEPSRARAAARKILELAVPSEEAGLVPGGRATFQVRLRRGGEELVLEEVEMTVPDFAARGGQWSVS